MPTFHFEGSSLDSVVTTILLVLLFLVGFAMSMLAPAITYTAAMRLP